MPIQAALKERITRPGTYAYVCPYLPPDERSALFPDYLNEPVFAITYNGYTHSTVPGFASTGMLSFLLAPMAAAWLLSQASAAVLATYSRRLLFVATLGLFIAVAAGLLRAVSGEQTFAAVAGPAVTSVVTWALVGLVLAWRIKPKTAGSQARSLISRPAPAGLCTLRLRPAATQICEPVLQAWSLKLTFELPECHLTLISSAYCPKSRNE